MAASSRILHATSKPISWKHAPPSLIDPLLPRDHLVFQIEQSLQPKQSASRITSYFVVAPAGYGKTTLIAQWANQATLPVVWYHLDASDDDPVACIRGLVEALRMQLPRGAWEVERFIGRVRVGPPSPLDVRHAAAILSSDMRRCVTKPLVLVLTGLSDLAPLAGGYKLLDELVNRPPDHVQVVIESREYPRLHVASLLMQHRLEGLNFDSLKLRPDEFRALIDRAGVRATEDEIRHLEELCAGWLTGVLLATGALLPRFLESITSDQFDHERVIDYLSREILDRLPTDLREFSVRAAVFSSMRPEWCDELLGTDDARSHLIALEKRTGFVSRVGGEGENPVYRFQPFLREAFLDELAAAPEGSSRRRMLHDRAGHLLEQRSEYEEAAQQYALAGDHDALVALVEARRSVLLRGGQGATLVRWILLLPEGRRARWPQLEVLLAELHRYTGNAEQARKAAHDAAHILRGEPRDPKLAARLLVVMGHIAFQEGRNEDALALSERALALTPDGADEVALGAGLLGASAHLAMDGPDRAVAVLDDLARRCGNLRDAWAVALMQYVRSKSLLTRGAYDAAEAAAVSALASAQEAGDEITAINARLNLGAIAARRRHVAAAQEQFKEAQAQAIAAGYLRGQIYAAINRADVYTICGNYKPAIVVYQEAWPIVIAAEDMHLRTCLAANLAYCLVADGQARAAMAVLQRELGESECHARDLNWVDLVVALGYAYTREGECARATTILQEACDRAQELHAGLKVARARLYLAVAAVGVDHAAAVEWLRAALADAAPFGIDAVTVEVRRLGELHPLLDCVDHPLASELKVALAADGDATLDPPNVSSRLAPSADFIELSAAETGAEIGLVRIFTLGEPRVFVGTDRVRHWRKLCVRDLLLFLAERGSVSTDQALAALWPDCPEERGKALFREARSRLSDALGMGESVIKDDHRWRLNVRVRVDAHEFEALLADGEQSVQEGDLTSAATAYRQALTLWRGPYLDDLYGEWPVLRRDALQRRYEDGLEHLGEVELRLRRLDDAIQHFFVLLEIDRTRESAYRGLMRAFALRGEIASALQQYVACEHMLARELNMPPSQETATLAQALRARANATRGLHDSGATGA